MKVQARKISGGVASGPVLLSRWPLSFLGGVDRATGVVVDPGSDVRGEPLQGRILAFPQGKGSTVGSYVIYGLQREGKGPLAMVNERCEAIVATGAIMAGVPLVDQVDLEILRPGDHLTVDGDEGTLDIAEVKSMKHVVTSFLENGGDILLLKRSQRVGSFQGFWAGVSGYLEPGDTPEQRARIEMFEETGVKSPKLVHAGGPIQARGAHDPTILWIVHPFLWHVADRTIQLDWEHVDLRWINPVQIRDFETVPNLAKALASATGSPTPLGRPNHGHQALSTPGD